LWYQDNQNFKLYGTDLKKVARERQEAQRDFPAHIEINSAKEETVSQLKNAFDIARRYRRLATTEKGYLCLAPSTSRPEDLIVILFDCSVPVVLRRKHQHFEFIGTCYVHGIMQGESMVGLSSQDAVEFEIR
jgi:hypothetical protein